MENRIIKFRGKSTIDDTWVYGSYMFMDDNKNNPMGGPVKQFHQILAYFSGDWNMGGWEAVNVKPETVSQFSGLKDKNGQEIYDGDIIKFPSIASQYYEECGREDTIKEITTTVMFQGGCFCLEDNGAPLEYYTPDFQVINDDYTEEMFKYVWNMDEFPDIKPEDIDMCVVIGNKFDNPELIETNEVM